MGSKSATLDSCVTFPISDTARAFQKWRVFYSIVRSRVSDPKSRDEKWVYKDYPDVKLQNLTEEEQIKSKYPLVVVQDPDFSDEPVTIDHKTTEYNDSQIIEIYSDRSDNMTTVWQSIDYQITKSAGQDMIEECGIFRPKLAETDYDSTQHAGVKIHVKTLTYEYEFPEER